MFGKEEKKSGESVEREMFKKEKNKVMEKESRKGMSRVERIKKSEGVMKREQ